MDYIVTWFYKESKDEAGYYPQIGGKGSSALVHSIYMQILVPFYETFRHYNPKAELMFFTNLQEDDLPDFLLSTLGRLGVETVSLHYTCRPPKGWHTAWQNQFYLYDMLYWMGNQMHDIDTLLICDADCLCRHPLNQLFEKIRECGSALYELFSDPNKDINGINLRQIGELYNECYGTPPKSPMAYYGGEFVGLRGDVVKEINTSFPELWAMNLERAGRGQPKLNEEAHVLSVLAEKLGFRNDVANEFVKRLWNTPKYNNVAPGDENLSVWHLPYEKKRGLHRLYKLMTRWLNCMDDEQSFWEYVGHETGIPSVSVSKRFRDRISTIGQKLGIR